MKRQKRAATRAMRVESGEHKPSEASRYADKKARRARFARAGGYEVGTPWPAMGVRDSRAVSTEG